LFKSKAVPVHAMKAEKGGRHTDPPIPTLGTRWTLSGQLHTPAA